MLLPLARLAILETSPLFATSKAGALPELPTATALTDLGSLPLQLPPELLQLPLLPGPPKLRDHREPL